SSKLAKPLGTPTLLLVAAFFLLLAIFMAVLLTRIRRDIPTAGERDEPVTAISEDTDRIGGSAWAGLREVISSPYLLGIAGYVLLMTLMGTLIYFTRLQMVAAEAVDLDARTTLLGSIDMWTQTAVLLLQLTLTGQIVRRFGLGFALAVLPVATAVGFVGLAIYGSFVVLGLLEATNRAVQRGLT
ncbi:MFS transporter, partial [Solirubrobacter sp. CPCC 204708]|nr:MFS transporter [Solirubrobacter deserti]